MSPGSPLEPRARCLWSAHALDVTQRQHARVAGAAELAALVASDALDPVALEQHAGV